MRDVSAQMERGARFRCALFLDVTMSCTTASDNALGMFPAGFQRPSQSRIFYLSVTRITRPVTSLYTKPRALGTTVRPWPIPCLARCSHHALKSCSVVSCAGFVPFGMRWACPCCGKWCRVSLALEGVAGAPFVDFVGLLFAVVLVIERISVR